MRAAERIRRFSALYDRALLEVRRHNRTAENVHELRLLVTDLLDELRAVLAELVEAEHQR